jgi:hypothetical protein
MRGMNYIDDERLNRAEHCMWLSARVLERRRFEHLFRGAPAAPVIDALRAYKTADGGFGHGIEPDFRGPISQPLSTDFGLRILAELTEPDPALLRDSLRYLKSITVGDGGVPNTLPSVRAFPRAPWWQPVSDTPPGSLLPTAGLAGLLYSFKLDDAWLTKASDFSWQALARLNDRAPKAQERIDRLTVAYEARAVMGFLDSVPERARAEQATAELGRALMAAKLIQVEPDASAEAAQPLEFASTPDSLAARWFEPKVFEAHLDAWVNAQQEHGGWNVPWMKFTPAVEHEWRGIITIERLKTLRAWGRLR